MMKKFSAAFDRVSRSGLLFKLKSTVVGGSMLSICRFAESSSSTPDRESWLMVLPVFGSQSFQACHSEVLGPLLFILYASEMFELVENRLDANYYYYY